MSKPLVLLTAPIKTRSGYGNHSRDVARALIESDKYNFKINSVPWGATPQTALEDNDVHNSIRQHILNEPSLPNQPDLHIHLVIPNEFNPIGKKNLGFTAGIETTVPVPEWVVGVNRMDETIFTSTFTETVFKNAEFKDDKQNQTIKMLKPSSTLFEGVDTDTYKKVRKFSPKMEEQFSKIDNDFCFLFTGHWLAGNLGEDRKDVGMMLKVFLETFKNQKNPPALVMKTSGADFSILDREDIKKKVEQISSSVKGKLPDVYLLHGDLTDSEMNEMYNHPKIKAHITFTHGEGFGRPLLEAAQSGKPVIAPSWSGQVDFLNQNYSVLLNGSLTQVPQGAFVKGMTFESPENKWFTVNYNIASSVMKDVVKNYSKYLLKGKQLAAVTSKKFSYEAMKVELVKTVDRLLEDVPKQVELKLPKLNKVK
jgi:glycosyltransferase involved in cell wall biosynthesis